MRRNEAEALMDGHGGGMDFAAVQYKSRRTTVRETGQDRRFDGKKGRGLQLLEHQFTQKLAFLAVYPL